MAFRLPVKAGSLNNLTDARYFAAFQVNWLGFKLDPLNPGSPAVSQVQDILNWISGPEIVIEFNNQSTEEVDYITRLIKPAGIQVPLDQEVGKKPEAGLRIFRNATLAEIVNRNPEAKIPGHDYLVIELEGSDQEKLENENQIAEQLQYLCKQYEVMLSGTWTDQNIIKMVTFFRPAALNVIFCQQPENGSPGYSDLDKILSCIHLPAEE